MAKKQYWFKRKRYGWGWVPVTWQGWLLVLGEILFLLVISHLLLKDVPRNTYHPNLLIFNILLLVSVIITVAITYKKGPQPKWRWGKKKSDNSKQDF